MLHLLLYLFIFYIKGYNLLERTIDEMIYRKFKNEAKNKEKKIENTNIKEEIIIPSKKEKTKKKKTKEDQINNIF